MRRALLLGFIAAAAALIATPISGKQATLSCADYPSQEVAQSVFIDADPQARAPMDPDGNGIACEGGSGSSGGATSGVLAQVADDRDCSDFATPQDAQEFFDGAGAGDPHQLDPDGDGVACESIAASASPGASPAASPTEAPVATEAPAATVAPNEELPNNGGPIETFTFAGLMCLLAGTVLIGWHRNMTAALLSVPRRVEQMPVLRAVIVRARR